LVEDHEERKDFPQGGGASSVQSRFIVRTTESCSGRPRLHAGLRGGEGWSGLAGSTLWVSAQHNFGIKKLSFNFQIFY
jgi:hypothetical protein